MGSPALKVGSRVGAIVGSAEGISVGDAEGLAVGDVVGTAGCAEGSVLGVAVGA